MARALFIAALLVASAAVSDARRNLWTPARDKYNVNTGGASTYITNLQKLKHMAVEHHSMVPPLIRTATGAFNLNHDNKIFNERATDSGITSTLTEDIPYWSFIGSAVATDDYIRLTPNRQSQQGAVWNLEPLDLPSFELRAGIRVHSRGNIGADGMAIWLVDEIPSTFGPIFGHPAKFHGLGILVDTYDNDSNRDNPVISLIYNSDRDKLNGRALNVDNDYKNDVLGRCTIDFRNQAEPTVLVLRYRAASGHDEGKIELAVIRTSGKSETETPCVTVPASQAPLVINEKGRNYWIGATAETGGMSDNHDLVFIVTLPLAGVEYDRDIHHILSDEEKEILQEEHGGERMHRYVGRKDKADREYWRAKTEEEQEAERQAKAKAYLEELQKEADERNKQREKMLKKLEEQQKQQQQQNNNNNNNGAAVDPQQQQADYARHHHKSGHHRHQQKQHDDAQQQYQQQQNNQQQNNQQQQQQVPQQQYNNLQQQNYQQNNNGQQQQYQQQDNQQQYQQGNNGQQQYQQNNNNGQQYQQNNQQQVPQQQYNNNQQQQNYQQNYQQNNGQQQQYQQQNNQQQYQQGNNGQQYQQNNNGQQYNSNNQQQNYQQNNNNGQQQQYQQGH